MSQQNSQSSLVKFSGRGPVTDREPSTGTYNQKKTKETEEKGREE